MNLLLGGALLRLMGLGVHPLWLDEGATWSWAVRETWGGTILAEANHPPAWWIVTRLWIQAFGDTEASLRAPAAILGVASIYLAWLLARRLLDPAHRPRRGGFDATPDDGTGRRQALWVAGFVAASTYFTEYAQEARMYAALIAEGLGLTLLYLRWLDRADRLSLVAYALLAAVALHTQYFAIWILVGHGAHALWLAWRTRRSDAPVRVAPFVLSNVAAGLLFVPWLVHMLRHYEGISTGAPFEPFGRLFYVLWRMGAGPGVVVVDRPRLELGVPAVLAAEWPMVALTVALWIPPVVLGALRLRRHPGLASLVLACTALPILLLLAVFPFFALIHERYLVFLAPWLLLLAVLGAWEAGRGLRWLLLGGLVALHGLGLVAYHGVGDGLVARDASQRLGEERVASRHGADPEDPLRVLHGGHPYGKEPWRQAHAFVSGHATPGDLVLLHPPYLHLVWDYYDRRARPRLLLPREPLPPREVEALHGPLLARATRVFLVLAHEETPDQDHYFEALREALSRLWLHEGMTRFQVAGPILFDRSWGVRVAVFNRR